MTLNLEGTLKTVIAGIVQAHVDAVVTEIAAAMADEVEARAQDRVADLRDQLDRGDDA